MQRTEVEPSAISRRNELPQNKSSRITSFARLLKKYPIPFLALIGLTAGGLIQIGFFDASLARFVWYATLIVGGASIVWETLRGILRRQFAADIVAMLAIVAAIFMDQAFAGVIVVLMQSGGEAIEDYGLRRASSSLDALLSRAPKIAHRLSLGKIQEIPVSDVEIGDNLVVRPGDLVPVDGTIVLGSSEIDESAITGEPLPKFKSVSDKVLGGSINTNLAFQMRADKKSNDSQYSKIVELVRKAQEYSQSNFERCARQYLIRRLTGCEQPRVYSSDYHSCDWQEQHRNLDK